MDGKVLQRWCNVHLSIIYWWASKFLCYIVRLDNVDRQLTCVGWSRTTAHLSSFSVSSTWQRDVIQVKYSSTRMLYVAASTEAPSTGAKPRPCTTSSHRYRVNCLSHFCRIWPNNIYKHAMPWHTKPGPTPIAGCCHLVNILTWSESHSRLLWKLTAAVKFSCNLVKKHKVSYKHLFKHKEPKITPTGCCGIP